MVKIWQLIDSFCSYIPIFLMLSGIEIYGDIEVKRSQLAFICSKSTMETSKQCVNYVKS